MADYYGNKTQAAKSIIHSILSDTILIQSDYRDWLGNIESYETDKSIIASYLQEEDTTSALSLLNMLPSLYELNGDRLDQYNDYKDLLLLQLSWKRNGISIYNLDSTDLLTLEFYANNSTGSAMYTARNILSYAIDTNYCDCLNSNDSSYTKAASISIIQNTIIDIIDLSSSPNPASTWVEISYNLFSDSSNGTISVTDLNGREIVNKQVTGEKSSYLMDTRNFKSGIYICTLTSFGSSKSCKIVIK
jgi:hypothetical protein